VTPHKLRVGAPGYSAQHLLLMKLRMCEQSRQTMHRWQTDRQRRSRRHANGTPSVWQMCSVVRTGNSGPARLPPYPTCTYAVRHAHECNHCNESFTFMKSYPAMSLGVGQGGWDRGRWVGAPKDANSRPCLGLAVVSPWLELGRPFLLFKHK